MHKYKNLYEGEILRNDRLRAQNTRHIIVIIMLAGIVSFCNYKFIQYRRTLKEASALLEQAQTALLEAQDKSYVVWKMDKSCADQLKNANMLYIKVGN